MALGVKNVYEQGETTLRKDGQTDKRRQRKGGSWQEAC